MEKQKVSLYTEAGICIDERLEKKETKLFTDRHEAEKFADGRNTYVYSAVNKRKQFVCLAVPIR